MKKIYYDSSFDCTFSPNLSITPYILVEDDFNLIKTIEVKIGERQKVNDRGQLLYLKDVFKTEKVENIIGYEESTKSTFNDKPLEPIMLEVQKTDEHGNNLYYKLSEEGEKVETTEETEEPVIVQVHKTNSIGKPLYHKPIIEVTTKEVKTGEEEVVEITLKPSIEDIMENQEVSVMLNPEYFKAQEVLKAKKEYMSKKYGENVFYEELLDLEQVASFTGNTGLGKVELAPRTKLKFKVSNFTSECNELVLLAFEGDSRIKIMAGNRQLKSEVTKLPAPINQVTYILNNDTNEYLEVSKIAIQAKFAELTEQEKLDARLTAIEENQARMQSVLDEMLLGGGI